MQATIEYFTRVPVPFQFGEMNPYFCHYAQAWHIGHKEGRAAIREVKYRMWGACDSVASSHIAHSLLLLVNIVNGKTNDLQQ